jgi:hypothetical protein
MLSIVACAICGGDPATDTMLVNAAVAGVLSVPWIFRDRFAAIVRRIRGKPQADEEDCPLDTDQE